MNDLGAVGGELLAEALKLREAAAPSGTFEQYLFAIFGESWKQAVFAGWFEDGEKRAPVLRLGKRYNTVVGQYEDVIERAEELREKGVGLPCFHMCINVVKAHAESRRADSFECARLVCVDIDRGITKKTVKELVERWQPNFIVKSSVNEDGEDVEGRKANYHFYWKCEDMDMASWAQFQLSLAWALEGDMSKTNAAATLRAPGFERVSKSGSRCVPGLVVLAEKVWDRVGLMGLFSGEIGGLAEAYRKAKEQRKAGYLELKNHLSLAKKNASGAAVAGAGAVAVSQVGRNNYLYYVLKELASGGAAIGDVEEQAKEINERFGIEGAGALDEREVESVVRSAFEKGHSRFEGRKAELGEMLSRANKIDNGETPMQTQEQLVDSIVEAAEQAVERSRMASNADGSDGLDLPESRAAAALMLAKLIVTEEGIRVFREAFVSNNFLSLAKYVKAIFLKIGSIKVDGLYVLTQGETPWGDTYLYKERIPKEDTALFFGHLLHDLVPLIWKAEIAEDSTEGLDRELLAIRSVILGKKGNKATSTMLDKMGKKLMERICHEIPAEKTQPGDLIVYQNGVLDLRGGVRGNSTGFVYDKYSPAKYSNPLAVRFDEDFAEKIEAAKARGELDLGKVKSLAEWVKRELPIWSKYMDEWFPGDSGAISLMLRITGMCMTTDVSPQKFMFFYGPSGAGKGSNSQVIQALVGGHNACHVRYRDLGRPFAISAAQGCLLAIVDEVNGKVEDHEDRMNSIKQCISGELYSFEKKFCNPVEAPFTAKLLLQSNEAPEYTDKGGSIARRMIAVGFERSFLFTPVVSVGAVGKAGEAIVSEHAIEGVAFENTPKGVILRSEAKKLATLAGLVWKATKDMKGVFDLEGRAAQAGREQLTSHMNRQRAILETYLEAGGSEDILHKAAVAELVALVRQEEDEYWNESEDIEGIKFLRTLTQDVVSLFGGVDASVRRRIVEDGKSKQVRFFGGLRFSEKGERLLENTYKIDQSSKVPSSDTAGGICHSQEVPEWAISHKNLWRSFKEYKNLIKCDR